MLNALRVMEMGRFVPGDVEVDPVHREYLTEHHEAISGANSHLYWLQTSKLGRRNIILTLTARHDSQISCQKTLMTFGLVFDVVFEQPMLRETAVETISILSIDAP